MTGCSFVYLFQSFLNNYLQYSLMICLHLLHLVLFTARPLFLVVRYLALTSVILCPKVQNLHPVGLFMEQTEGDGATAGADQVTGRAMAACRVNAKGQFLKLRKGGVRRDRKPTERQEANSNRFICGETGSQAILAWLRH